MRTPSTWKHVATSAADAMDDALQEKRRAPGRSSVPRRTPTARAAPLHKAAITSKMESLQALKRKLERIEEQY